MSNKTQHTQIVKEVANSLGFDFCGIAESKKLDDDARRLEQWLQNGMHGTMQYMEHYFDLRIDPQKLVPGSRSVITLLLNYFPANKQLATAPQISKYAYSRDYHEVIRSKLQSFIDILTEKIGQIHARGFVDSAPVLERTWAERSGLGWVGRNGNLITKESGSFFFIATLITDLDLTFDDPFAKDYCGTCTRCIDACPTDAIHADKVIDGSQCISYFTIELKDALIPDKVKNQFNNWMFGCDTCQDVCPWNRFSKPNNEASLTPLHEILAFTTDEWEDLTEDAFNKVFKYSPLKRAKFHGIQRNLKFLRTV